MPRSTSYFIHAKLLANWGYGQALDKAYEESMDEMRHTEQLVTASSTSTPSRT